MDENVKTDGELAEFRRQIDAIDDRLVALLRERIGIVSQVGELKRRTAPGVCPLRPGREARQVRRIMQQFAGTPFPPDAAAAIWRIIIGASTSVESPLTLSVFTPERDNELYWLGREYFGAFSPIIRQPHVKRVIGDVMDEKASIGIVPMLRSSDTTYWWTNLAQQGSDMPKIFARIPFVSSGPQGNNAPCGMALARIAPEPSGDDMSILVLEADHNVSQSRLQAAFAAAKLEASWINIATLHPAARHHLLEVKGFVTPEHEGMQALLVNLGASVFNLTFLGAYAVPVEVSAMNNVNDIKVNPHASQTPRA